MKAMQAQHGAIGAMIGLQGPYAGDNEGRLQGPNGRACGTQHGVMGAMRGCEGPQGQWEVQGPNVRPQGPKAGSWGPRAGDTE